MSGESGRSVSTRPMKSIATALRPPRPPRQHADQIEAFDVVGIERADLTIKTPPPPAGRRGDASAGEVVRRSPAAGAGGAAPGQAPAGALARRCFRFMARMASWLVENADTPNRRSIRREESEASGASVQVRCAADPGQAQTGHQASSPISSRITGCLSSAQTKSRARSARSRPITGVALAMNLASMAASLMGLAAVPVAWGM